MQEIIRYYPILVLDILYCYSLSESVDENPQKREQGQQNRSLCAHSLAYLLQGPPNYSL